MSSIEIGSCHIKPPVEADAQGQPVGLEHMPAAKIAVLNSSLGSHTGIWIIFPHEGFHDRFVIAEDLWFMFLTLSALAMLVCGRIDILKSSLYYFQFYFVMQTNRISDD